MNDVVEQLMKNLEANGQAQARCNEETCNSIIEAFKDRDDISIEVNGSSDGHVPFWDVLLKRNQDESTANPYPESNRKTLNSEEESENHDPQTRTPAEVLAEHRQVEGNNESNPSGESSQQVAGNDESTE